MRPPATSDPAGRRLRRPAAALALALAALLLAACGEEEEVPTLPAPSEEQWKARVNGFCSDGIQEASALPLPESERAIPLDAQTRADIVITVHDAILPLARPEGLEAGVDAYLAELNDDAKQLQAIGNAAATGEDYLALGEVDESAGQAAADLGLSDCVAFSTSVARTP